MIDTDKYEGHIQGEWRDTRHEGAKAHHIVAYNPQIAYANDAGDVKICTVFPNVATANLVADAPLLLEEVKRLGGIIDYIRDTGRMVKPKEVFGLYLSIMRKVLTTDEYIRWHLKWRDD